MVTGSALRLIDGSGSALLNPPTPLRNTSHVTFMTKNFKKIYSWKKINFFYTCIKNYNLPIQHFKTWNFLIFSTVVGHFCPPGSGSGFRIRIRILWPDLIRSHSESGSGSETLPLTNGSGSLSRRPKNIRILRIRIRNTSSAVDPDQVGYTLFWRIRIRTRVSISYKRKAKLRFSRKMLLWCDVQIIVIYENF